MSIKRIGDDFVTVDIFIGHGDEFIKFDGG